MPNDYYNNSSDPADNTDATPDVLRAEHAAIAAGFAKIAPYTGNGSKVVRINAGGTAQEAVDVATLGAQPVDADLTAIAALVSAANKIPYATAIETWAMADFTAHGRQIVGSSGNVLSRSSNTILGSLNFGDMVVATAAFTQTLTAAATLGDGWWCAYCAQGNSIVIDPNASETIDGATTKTVTGSGLIFCDGSNFFTIGFPSFSPITNTLGADVLLNNTGTQFTGPSCAQGTVGTWLAIGYVTLFDTITASLYCDLWDGGSSKASTLAYNIAGGNVVVPLIGIYTSPVGNIRIRVKDTSSVNGKILYNASTLLQDSQLTVLRIA